MFMRKSQNSYLYKALKRVKGQYTKRFWTKNIQCAEEQFVLFLPRAANSESFKVFASIYVSEADITSQVEEIQQWIPRINAKADT